MRKLLILTVAFVLGAGVFAKGSMTASAPTIAAALGEFDSMIAASEVFRGPFARKARPAVEPIVSSPAVAASDAHAPHFDASPQAFSAPGIDLDLGTAELKLDPSIWTEITGEERRKFLVGSLVKLPATPSSVASPAASAAPVFRQDLTGLFASATVAKATGSASGFHISEGPSAVSSLSDLLTSNRITSASLPSPFSKATRADLFGLSASNAFGEARTSEYKSVRGITELIATKKGTAGLTSRTSGFFTSEDQIEELEPSVVASASNDLFGLVAVSAAESDESFVLSEPAPSASVKDLLAAASTERKFSVVSFAEMKMPEATIVDTAAGDTHISSASGREGTVGLLLASSASLLEDRNSIRKLASSARVPVSVFEKRFVSRADVSDLFAGRSFNFSSVVSTEWAVTPAVAEDNHSIEPETNTAAVAALEPAALNAVNADLESPARVIGNLTDLAIENVRGIRSVESGFVKPVSISLTADKSPVAVPNVPSWATSTATVSGGLSLSVAPMTNRRSTPPATRAATVVNGVPMLNVAPMQSRAGDFCDPNFVGEPIRFSQTAELTLEDFLLQVHNRFGVNFLIGPNVGKLPINIKAGSMPWNILLRSQLFISGVRARCVNENTVELIENRTLPSLQDTADVATRFVKLKFLQRTGGGTVDLANRSQGGQNGAQGGCGGASQGGGSAGSSGGQGGSQTGDVAAQQVNNKFDRLIVEIEKILGIRSMSESSVGGGGGSFGGGQGSAQGSTEVRRTNRFVTQVPGRNILAIRATEEEHSLIDEIINLADRPPFQVVVKGLVYSANEAKLRDIGVQTTILGGTADGRSGGGIFGHTIGEGGTLFDFSTIIGTFDFNVQATALQQNGVISVKSRPFATVLDGLCTVLEVGRQLPIVIDSSLGGVGTVTFVDASNNLAVTPYVIDDDQGNPQAVMLELRLAANDVDTSVTARGVPAVSKRSVQTQLLLGENKTAILGGFTVDQDSRSVSKTPGLGDIPIIGELFKRRIRDTRINRLYFAITVAVIPYGEAIRPVDVPGVDTNPPSITPEMKKRGDKAEPKQVVGKPGN